MEINFPLEFLVNGTPVSSQGSANSIAQWKALVRDASSAALPSPHFVAGGRFSVTLYYLPDAPMQGDIDNIVKPILDALIKHIYFDDNLVERVVVQKFEPETDFVFHNPTPILALGISEARPVLYVRISADPHEELR